jgi:hypothetical protein
MVSISFRVIVVTLLLAGFGATASARSYALVQPRVCLAGIWGKPVAEWRVQLGVFDDERKAVAFERRLARAKVKAEHYIAIWRQRGDAEPMAVVTRAVYKNAKAARRAALNFRKAGHKAFARRYLRYRWSRSVGSKARR